MDAAVNANVDGVVGIRSDAKKLADPGMLFTQIKETAGYLNVLYANADGGAVVPLGLISEEHFDKTFDRNVKSVLFR